MDHREDLVAERTRIQSRLRWHLHELFRGLDIAPKSLRRYCVLASLEERLAPVTGTVAGIARERLLRCRELTVRADELERDIRRAECPLGVEQICRVLQVAPSGYYAAVGRPASARQRRTRY